MTAVFPGHGVLSRRHVVALLGAALCMPGPVQAQTGSSAARPLVYVDEDQHAPMSQRLPDGNVVGLKVECVDLVAKEAGIFIRHESYPWARAQKMVEVGEADAFCTTPTAELAAFAWFCEHPLIPIPTFAYFLRSSPKAERISQAKTIDDLHGLSFVEYLGNSWASAALLNERVNRVNSSETAIKALELGHADIFLDSTLATGPALARLGLLSRIGWVPIATSVTQDYHLGIRHTLPEGRKLIALCDAAIERLNARGDLKRILRENGIL